MKVSLISSNGVKYIRCPQNKKYYFRHQVLTVNYRGSGVMVLKFFSRSGVGLLVRIEENMDRFVYQNKLKTQMLPYAKQNKNTNYSNKVALYDA